MYRWFLAVRFLWARPISWVSMVGIWLSVMALIATIGIMSGFLEKTREMIRGTASDLTVSPLSIRTARGGLQRPDFAEIAAEARAVEGVKDLAPRLVRPVLLRVGERFPDITGLSKYLEMLMVQVVGVDPEQERGVSEFDRHVREAGAYGDPPADPAHPFRIEEELVPPEAANMDLPVVLLGEGLFRFWGLARGDVITLVTYPDDLDIEEFKPLSRRFIVGGSVYTGHHEIDRRQLYMQLSAARDFAETEHDASEIAVAAVPGADLATVRDRLAERFARNGLRANVETWMDRNGVLLGAVENERAILGFILFFFVAVACFNVFATLTIMVTDKTKDIGILNAIGATQGGVMGIFVLAGVTMALFASTLGCISGVLVGRNINAINDGLGALIGQKIFRPDIYMFDRIPVVIEPWFVAGAFVLTIAFALLCSLLPALRAARMDPVRALRYE